MGLNEPNGSAPLPQPPVQGEQLLHLAQLPPALSPFATCANPPVSKASPLQRPLGEITIIMNNSHVPGPLDSQHGQQNTSHRQRPSAAQRAALPGARPGDPRGTWPTRCPELHGSQGKHCLRAGASSEPQITANSHNDGRSTPGVPLAGPCQEGSHHTRTPLPFPHQDRAAAALPSPWKTFGKLPRAARQCQAPQSQGHAGSAASEMLWGAEEHVCASRAYARNQINPSVLTSESPLTTVVCKIIAAQ